MFSSLGRIRADRTGDARSWTPVEMLEDVLREARAGALDLSGAILLLPVNDKEDHDVEIRRAGIDNAEELLMIRAAMRQAAGL